MKALVLGAVLAVIAVPAWAGAEPVPATSAGPAEIDAALKRVLDGNYQAQLPHEQDTANAGKGGRSQGKRRGRELHPGSPGWRPPESYSMQPGGGLARIASLLLWTIVAVVVALLVLRLVQALRGRSDDAAVAAGPEPGDSGAAERAALVARPLGDAEALAQQGRFADAIHALLLRTIEELARGLPTGLPRAYTSREIVARVAMPGRARGALSDLVTSVERCYFGTGVPGAAEYEACRARFQEFAQAYVRGAAA